jgi:hypothetical protein
MFLINKEFVSLLLLLFLYKYYSFLFKLTNNYLYFFYIYINRSTFLSKENHTFLENNEVEISLIENDVKKEKEKEQEKRYEDKYLDELRKLKKEFILNDFDNELYNNKLMEFNNKHINDHLSDDDYTKMEEDIKEFVITEKLKKLINNFVIEKTPLGNVMMIYSYEKSTFSYYSDNNIPYRYLEVVARKYVKFFGCRPIFVDMEEELKLCEEKLENQKRIEEEKKLKKLQENNSQKTKEFKKDIFTKFKSYNNKASSGHINVAAPPKNSIPNNSTANVSNENVLLKENANRYTFEGKISNFPFLKKIDKKVVDKKYAMSFSDFKKLNKVI